MIKNKLGKYNLPTLVQYCKNCTRSNQRPHNMGEFNQKINEKKNMLVLIKKDYVELVSIISKKIK